MPKDKYTAVWVSHTSLSDYQKCPRSYYLKNVYKDPQTGHKFQIMSPSLALGSAVHEVIENLSIIPTADRFKESLIQKFDKVWESYTGERGGFFDTDQEHHFKERGKAMLNRVMEHPGPLLNRAVKINQDLPHYFLSEEDNIILCGKIDWLEYFQDTDSVHIIDFKTSKKEESEESLQLPIYLLLVQNCQKRNVDKASYWYLDLKDVPSEQTLPNAQEAEEGVLKIARQIKLARKLERFSCPHGDEGCLSCQPLEQIIRGEGKYIWTNKNRQDVYISSENFAEKEDSTIL